MATAVTSMRIPTELNERYSRLAKETWRIGARKRKSPSKLGGSRGIRDKEIIAWRQTLARRR